jgi:acetyl esterase
MPLHAQARYVLDLLAHLGAPALDSQEPAVARAERAALVQPPVEDCHEIRDLDAGGVPVRLYLPRAPQPPLPLLIWLHGGGWVLGDLESHDNVCRALCNRADVAVLAVGYRLAPEDPFPAALDDGLAVCRWAVEHAGSLGIDARRVALGGDSAGANLAAVVCNLAPIDIAFQVLVYPVTDARCASASYTENGDGYFLTASSMRWFVDHYLSGGSGSPDDPTVSPLLADDETLAAGPPTLVLTAGYDPLRDEGIAYADRLGDLGVTVSHVHFPGQIHGFFSLPHVIDDAKVAYALVADAVHRALA